MRKLLCALLCLVGVGLAVADEVDTVSRLFTLDHISVSAVSTAVQPLLSEHGSLTLQPSRSRLSVQDVPSVVEKVAKLIDELDRAPDHYRIHIELIEGSEASYSSAEPASVQVDSRLRSMFKFPSFHRLGGATLEGEIGDSAVALLGGDHQVSFLAQRVEYSPDTPWGAPNPGNRIQLRHFLLKWVGDDPAGTEKTQELLQTSMFLSANQKVYIGAGKSEDAENGLVLIVHAQSIGAR